MERLWYGSLYGEERREWESGAQPNRRGWPTSLGWGWVEEFGGFVPSLRFVEEPALRSLQFIGNKKKERREEREEGKKKKKEAGMGGGNGWVVVVYRRGIEGWWKERWTSKRRLRSHHGSLVIFFPCPPSFYISPLLLLFNSATSPLLYVYGSVRLPLVGRIYIPAASNWCCCCCCSTRISFSEGTCPLFSPHNPVLTQSGGRWLET